MSAAAMSRQHYDEMEGYYDTSPIHRTLGLKLKVPGDGEAVIVFDGSPGSTNRRGDAAGGAIAQMIDSAVVQAARTRLGHTDSTVTIELKVNYIRAAPAKLNLTARGQLDHFGRTTAVGNARVVDETGKLYALGIVTVSIKKADAA
ncbi:MAG: PaaI family thioesterase [Alphaproteobacteria bacterium]|nr:PaaI family thioesterase [Alphaproteobacteria bacterium]MBU1517145.1 PaaI family thioesterase [Alphaproteobacteria bacterium]MBU2096522.1 PaaI family thioesterase [Alphaproteobacteria bacterium]MBU2151674.1 PaaI family thioesterase [Alphaproteobacteria bacterium]MBU2305448.1 PaaI family thioesterase [Alphaproteobacteria bacterium]